MIISPLPILANIANVNTETGLLRDNKNTSGKQVINKNAPKM